MDPHPTQLTIVNVHWYGGKVENLPPSAVYVGRGRGKRIDRYSNRFEIGKDGDRATVCRKFKGEFEQRLKNPAFAAQLLKDFEGKTMIACWCAQRGRQVQCHGETIKAAVETLRGLTPQPASF